MRFPFLRVFNYASIRIKIEMQKNLTFQYLLRYLFSYVIEDIKGDKV